MGLLASILVSDILPIFAIASAGFLLAQYARVDVKMLARVVFYSLLPCLAFRLLVTSISFRATRRPPDVVGRADHGRHGVAGLRRREGAGPRWQISARFPDGGCFR